MAEAKERILDLAERFVRAARYHFPAEWLRADLTMPQLKVLLTLYLDGPQSCSALASALRLSLPTMTGILDRLQARGYLLRRHDERDRRRVISHLSPRGEALVERLWAAGREELAATLDGVPAEDLPVIERALGILIRALERRGEPALSGRRRQR